MPIVLDSNYSYLTAKRRFNEKDILQKLYTSLSNEKMTPIDISDAEIGSIENSYITYMLQNINYDWESSATIGYDRKIYQDVVETYKDSRGLIQQRVVNKYVKTVTDWQNHYDNNSYFYEVFELMSEDKEGLLKSTDKIIKEKLKLDNLEHEESEVNQFSNVYDLQEVRNNILDNSISALGNHIKSATPGDRYKNLNYNYTLKDENCYVIYLPFTKITYSHEGETYTAYFCDSIDHLFYDFPKDEALKEAQSEIYGKGAKKIGFLAAIVAVISYFFWYDEMFNEYMWWFYGVVALISFFLLGTTASEAEKEFIPVKEEKSRRLELKLKELNS